MPLNKHHPLLSSTALPGSRPRPGTSQSRQSDSPAFAASPASADSRTGARAALSAVERRIAELEQALDQAQQAAQPVATPPAPAPGLLLIDNYGQVALMDERCCTLFGLPLPASNWLGFSVQDIINWLQKQVSDPASFRHYIRGRWQGPDVITGEKLTLRNGRRLEWDYHPTAASIEGGFLLIFREVVMEVMPEVIKSFSQVNVLQQLPAEVVVFDPECRYVFANAAAVPEPAVREWMLGRTSTEYCAYRNYPPDFVQQRQQQLQLLLETRVEVQWTEHMPGSDAPRHVLRTLRPVTDEQGKLQCIISLGTELAQATTSAYEDLRQQYAFYEMVLDKLPAEVVVYDAQQQYCYANAQAEPDPATRAWLMRKTDLEYASQHPEYQFDLDRRRYMFEEAVRHRHPMRWEETQTRPDGSEQHFLRVFCPVFGPGQELQMMVGYGVSITSQRQVENKLRASEQRMRTLFLTLPGTLLVTNRTGSIRDAKIGEDVLLNEHTDQLIGNHLTEVLPPEIAEQVLIALFEMLHTGQPTEFSFMLPHAGAALSYKGRWAALEDDEVLLTFTRRDLQDA